MSRINWAEVSPTTAPTATIPTWGGGEARVFAPAPGGFVVAGPWAAIYRLAYERALAATQPSRFQKMMEPCWN